MQATAARNYMITFIYYKKSMGQELYSQFYKEIKLRIDNFSISSGQEQSGDLN